MFLSYGVVVQAVLLVAGIGWCVFIIRRLPTLIKRQNQPPLRGPEATKTSKGESKRSQTYPACTNTLLSGSWPPTKSAKQATHTCRQATKAEVHYTHNPKKQQPRFEPTHVGQWVLHVVISPTMTLVTDDPVISYMIFFL